MTPNLCLLAHLLHPMVDEPMWLTTVRWILAALAWLVVAALGLAADHMQARMIGLYRRWIATSSRARRSGRTRTLSMLSPTTWDGSSAAS